MDLLLRIIIEKPLKGIDYALQSGSGNKFELVQKQVSGAGNLFFNFSVKVKGDKDEQPDFAGLFVQGNKRERFVYINIGTYAGNPDSEWGRRLKIPLQGVTWNMVGELSGNSDFALVTHVSGTGKDRTPSCATVKPFAGWTIEKNNRRI